MLSNTLLKLYLFFYKVFPCTTVDGGLKWLMLLWKKVLHSTSVDYHICTHAHTHKFTKMKTSTNKSTQVSL